MFVTTKLTKRGGQARKTNSRKTSATTTTLSVLCCVVLCVLVLFCFSLVPYYGPPPLCPPAPHNVDPNSLPASSPTLWISSSGERGGGGRRGRGGEKVQQIAKNVKSLEPSQLDVVKPNFDQTSTKMIRATRRIFLDHQQKNRFADNNKGACGISAGITRALKN